MLSHFPITPGASAIYCWWTRQQLLPPKAFCSGFGTAWQYLTRGMTGATVLFLVVPLPRLGCCPYRSNTTECTPDSNLPPAGLIARVVDRSFAVTVARIAPLFSIRRTSWICRWAALPGLSATTLKSDGLMNSDGVDPLWYAACS